MESRSKGRTAPLPVLSGAGSRSERAAWRLGVIVPEYRGHQAVARSPSVETGIGSASCTVGRSKHEGRLAKSAGSTFPRLEGETQHETDHDDHGHQTEEGDALTYLGAKIIVRLVADDSHVRGIPSFDSLHSCRWYGWPRRLLEPSRLTRQGRSRLASASRSRWGLRVPAAFHFLLDGLRSSMAMLPSMLEQDRTRAGWSGRQAAWRLGVSVRAYRELETGDRSPTFETWDRTCKTFGWPQAFIEQQTRRNLVPDSI